MMWSELHAGDRMVLILWWWGLGFLVLAVAALLADHGPAWWQRIRSHLGSRRREW